MANTLTLDDKTIGQIAKCVQVSILTGTDVVDHLRQLQLTVNTETSSITVTDEYLSVFNANIEKMLQEAAEKATEQAQNEPQQLSLFE